MGLLRRGRHTQSAIDARGPEAWTAAWSDRQKIRQEEVVPSLGAAMAEAVGLGGWASEAERMAASDVPEPSTNTAEQPPSGETAGPFVEAPSDPPQDPELLARLVELSDQEVHSRRSLGWAVLRAESARIGSMPTVTAANSPGTWG